MFLSKLEVLYLMTQMYALLCTVFKKYSNCCSIEISKRIARGALGLRTEHFENLWLADLKWNNFFLSIRGQRWSQKTLIFCFFDDVSEVLETRLAQLVHMVQKKQETMSFLVSLSINH